MLNREMIVSEEGCVGDGDDVGNDAHGCSLPNKQIRFPELYETVSDASRVLSPPINFSATYLEKEANGGAPGVFYPGILDSFFESDYYNSEKTYIS
ncbi:hypothetical protein MAR_007756 [Mya arenaria]|uniref:Uncharacterized protein n=1 Tax=Mya arenaria TaxID=6604 RepID=A0ABY7DTY1_MYAAR|nr:hypothetical protein MAR_007756 [Mya arenaria]